MTAIDICREAFWVLTPFAFALGACIGSFLNVVIWRLPRGESLSAPPSHCPKCGHGIRPWENIPLVSWLALRARCSSCREPISPRYPAVELLTAVVFLGVWFRVVALGLPPSSLIDLFFLAGALIAVTFTDIEHRIIPGKVTYSGIAVGLGTALFLPSSHQAAISSRGGLDGGYFLGELFFSWLPLPPLPERFVAVADSAAGAVLALAGLWAIRVLAGAVAGHRRIALGGNTLIRLDSRRLSLHDGQTLGWEEVISCTVRLRNPQFALAAAATGGPPPPAESGDAVLEISRNRIRAGKWSMPLSRIGEVRGEGIEVKFIRDVLGWGDIKLIAMIGALLGAEALPFILGIGAGSGLVAGTFLRIFSPACRRQGVPFAPFLALATTVWIFSGGEFLAWYEGILAGL